MPSLFEMFGQVDEAVGGAVVYHGTDPDNAEGILEFNRITGHTEHNAKPLKVIKGYNRIVPVGFRQHEIAQFDRVSGVSLTRDPNFARRWKSGQGVVFALDANKLRQNFRMIPYDYYGNRAEAEEFLVGHLTNVSRYLLAIEVSQKVYDEMVEDNEMYMPGEGRYVKLVEHPLLRIVGQTWDRMTGQIKRAA
jgi:hypothetical protein